MLMGIFRLWKRRSHSTIPGTQTHGGPWTYNYIYIYIPINTAYIYYHNSSYFPEYICDIFGYYIWLQSDAAFYYLRLDKCSFSVGMFCVTCDVTRRPLGRLATACSWEGNVFRHGERGLVASVLGKFLMGQDLSQIYERYH